jgi:hypothetical protein
MQINWIISYRIAAMRFTNIFNRGLKRTRLFIVEHCGKMVELFETFCACFPKWLTANLWEGKFHLYFAYVNKVFYRSLWHKVGLPDMSSKSRQCWILENLHSVLTVVLVDRDMTSTYGPLAPNRVNFRILHMVACWFLLESPIGEKYSL